MDEEEDPVVQFGLNRKKGTCVIFRDHRFNKLADPPFNGIQGWLCSVKKCPSIIRVTTTGRVTNLAEMKPHKCSVSARAQIVAKTHALLDESARRIGYSDVSSNIIHDLAQDPTLDTNVMLDLHNRKPTHERYFREQRRKIHGPQVKEPAVVALIDITEDKFRLLDGEPFLLYDNRGNQSEESRQREVKKAEMAKKRKSRKKKDGRRMRGRFCRIMIFATPDMLGHFSRAKFVASDGTFKIKPNGFYQVYVLLVQVERPDGEKYWTPTIYVLMTRKLEQHYVEVFGTICNLCVQYGFPAPDPECWMFDFEKAAMNAARRVFLRCKIKGCLFHLKSNLVKHAKRPGQNNIYRNDPGFRHFCYCLAALCHLPLDEVEDGLNELRASVLPNHPNFASYDDMAEYFLNTYVIKITFRGGIARRSIAAYPPILWNHWQTTLSYEGRTNNRCEGHNNKLRTSYRNRGHQIYTFIDWMQGNMRWYRQELRSFFLGGRGDNPPIPRYAKLQRQLAESTMDYEFGLIDRLSHLHKLAYLCQLSKEEAKVH